MTAVARRVDALVAEIGSTTTVVSAFDGLRDYPAATPCLVGQGVAPTSVGRAPEAPHEGPPSPAFVADGDVTIGVNAARARLEGATGPLAPSLTLATSSAAGGLRMTVHGLTQRMTAMAAREAALGAGAVVKYQTAGRLRDHDLREIEAVEPNLILLAGGVEGGDCDTVLFNAERLAGLRPGPSWCTPATRSSAATLGNCSSGPASGSSSPTTCIRRSTSSTSCRRGPSSTTPSRNTSRTRPAWSASARS